MNSSDFLNLNLPIENNFNTTQFYNTNISSIIQQILLSNKTVNAKINNEKKTTNIFKSELDNFTSASMLFKANFDDSIFYDSLKIKKDLLHSPQKRSDELEKTHHKTLINNNRKILI